MKQRSTPPTTLADFLNPNQGPAPDLVDDLLKVNETAERTDIFTAGSGTTIGNESFGMSMLLGSHTNLKPILKRSTTDTPIAAEPSPMRAGKQRKLTFAGDHDMSALSPPRQFAAFGSSFQSHNRRSSSSSGDHSSLSNMAPSTQRVVAKFREGYAKIIGLEALFADGGHHQYHHEPLAKVTSSREWDTHMKPMHNAPLDPLLEGQVAMLEHQAKQHMSRIETILGKPMTVRQAPVGADASTVQRVANEAMSDKLFVDLELVRLQKGWEASKKQMAKEDESRSSHPPPQRKESLNPLRTAPKSEASLLLPSSTVLHASRVVVRDPPSPSLRPMAVSTHSSPNKKITGQDIIQAREAEAEAMRKYEALQRDPKVQRQKRWVNALESMQRRAEVLRELDIKQTRAKEEQEAGRRGKKRTTEDLITDWRKELQDTAENEEKIEARDRARAYRKALRAEREEARHVADVLSGMTNLQLADKRQQELEEKERRRERKRWRITRVGSVDVFEFPRWSSKPCATLRGDVTVEELDVKVVDNIPWILVRQGWIPVQLSFGGFCRTQLFADAPTDDGNGVLDAMFEELDDVHEKVLDAITLCPPEQLKGQTEIKEIMKQMEFTRQSIRDLPGGRRDMIRQLWDEMQRKESHTTSAASLKESAFQRELAEIEERVLARETDADGI